MDDPQVKLLWDGIIQLREDVARGSYIPPLTVHQLLEAGKAFWKHYDECSRKAHSRDVANALTVVAGRILEGIILLAHDAPYQISAGEKTELLVNFVVSTGLRGRILVVENISLMMLEPFKPVFAILSRWAYASGKNLEDYLDEKRSKDWFSSEYDPAKEGSFTITESVEQSMVFTSLMVTAE